MSETNPSRPDIRLRELVVEDIDVLFLHQLDPEANLMAAVYPRDEHTFRAQFETIAKDAKVIARAILSNGELVGHINCFEMDGHDAVGYWIAREHWGRGVATRALELFLEEVSIRPLFARVAKHNVASIRVLEKCGFVITGFQHSPGTERYVACEEAELTLR